MSAELTIDRWLRDAVQRGLPRNDARHLLAHVAGQPLSWLMMASRDPLDQHLSRDQQLALEAHTTDLLRDVPLAYVLGHQPFLGLDLAVTPATLVPRDDTATLVEWGLEALTARATSATGTAVLPLRVLDLGTGSGAVVLALAHAYARQASSDRASPVVWQASDLCPKALAVAQANAARHGLDIAFFEGHWLNALPRSEHMLGWDVIVSNPPYIADHDTHLHALRHEPKSALVAGPEGLNDLRHIVATAAPLLRPGGTLLLEHGWDQMDAVSALIAAAGLSPLPPRRDDGGQWRCSGGRRAGPLSAD